MSRLGKRVTGVEALIGLQALDAYLNLPFQLWLDWALASQILGRRVTPAEMQSLECDDAFWRMKVRLDGTRLLEIGKTLPPASTDGESIGLLLFRGAGPELFVDAVDRALRVSEGLKSFYLKVIDQLARSHRVETATIEGLSWGEVDYPADLQRAERLVADGRLG